MSQSAIKLFPILVLGVLLSFWGFVAPIKDALNIGGDDKFELSKAQVVERQPGIASRMDNDQPWLNTLIVARAFALFGENAAIPRLFTLALTFLLVLACWHLMGECTNLLNKILFICYYFTSSGILHLATSAMLEPQAIALAVVAVALTYSELESLKAWRAYTSGVFIADRKSAV